MKGFISGEPFFRLAPESRRKRKRAKSSSRSALAQARCLCEHQTAWPPRVGLALDGNVILDVTATTMLCKEHTSFFKHTTGSVNMKRTIKHHVLAVPCFRGTPYLHFLSCAASESFPLVGVKILYSFYSWSPVAQPSSSCVPLKSPLLPTT